MAADSEPRSPDTAPGPGRGRPPGATALVLGVLAAVVSAISSWHVSLWSDEAATISASSRSLADLTRLIDHIDAVHATYYVLMHPWVALVHTSPLGLRLPSAIAIGAAVAGVYLLTRRLADHRTALYAAFVAMALPRLTWAGIEARPFALAAALAVWSTVILEAALRRRRFWLYAGYAVLLGLGVAVNLYVALVAVAHLVTVATRRDLRQSLEVLAAAACGAVLSSPVVLLGLGQGGQLGVPDRGPLTLLRSVVVDQWFLGETPTPTTGSGTLDASPFAPGEWWKLASVVVALACWALVAVALLRRDQRTVVPWALPWLAVPTVLTLAAALVEPTLYNARYFGIAAPAMAMLVAAGLRELSTRTATGVLVALAVLVAPVYLSQRTVTAKSGSDWSLVAAELEGRTAPGDGVYFGPRDDLVDGVALRSLRTAAIAYPEPFTGLVDITLIASPAEGGTLFGTSRSLAASADELAGVDTLWVLRREDRPAAAAEEDQLLADAGFVVVSSWSGPQTEVLELVRD
ncbi:glycosyltransferase family 39 protein [Actinotalea sp. M2MS4P-6]|uniref:glycosyltransferase family 39 protein n=1 Tax=Actinotalea sp. M2MS4P-6 TaxID=2983762 RepID=UPI0021E3DF9F|nr:glycosyltransferase family 39 protein [Actinotalea sp. M2MS4P-6]MCV2395819.1 glycosyltransferase family 39 protein [Actinotalea sp. M2MS4P-6]